MDEGEKSFRMVEMPLLVWRRVDRSGNRQLERERERERVLFCFRKKRKNKSPLEKRSRLDFFLSFFFSISRFFSLPERMKIIKKSKQTHKKGIQTVFQF